MKKSEVEMNKSSVVRAVVGIVATIALGWFLGWTARDLIWGLWLSSLTVGVAFFFINLFIRTITQSEKITFKGVIAAFFLLCFLLVHYGIFHFVHSLFLATFFPLNDAEGSGIISGGAMYLQVIKEYWPLALITIWMERDLFLSAKNKGGIGSVYKKVVKMHLWIFIAAGLIIFKLDSFIVYAAACLFFFFPFEALGIWRKK